MVEAEDRLCDDFFTENELHKMALSQLESNKYSEEPTNICFYHLFKDGKQSGLVLIAAVKSVIDGQDAIDKLWAEAGITAIVGEYSEESVLNQFKADAIYLLLNKYKYEGKLKLPGSDRVYQYQEWMDNLI